MSAMNDLSNALGAAADKAAGGVLAIHGGRCETATGVAWSEQHVVTATHALDPDGELEVTVAG